MKVFKTGQKTSCSLFGHSAGQMDDNEDDKAAAVATGDDDDE